jgi:hypothetical protein
VGPKDVFVAGHRRLLNIEPIQKACGLKLGQDGANPCG